MSTQENGTPSPPPAPAGEPVISVRDVAKMYRLFNKPQDRLKNMLFFRFGKRYGREFWALQGITFDVQKGETVGIIGRNGSGKSTLLQIIAGTLEPTVGNVQVRGRVAALLELGSGFNAEYTGRENVYMNGAILGLTRNEMDQRFDDIAAFADIGEFIEQPVKTYSSGMLVRLAFAVQAFVPKEVLIVDEALSVGDMFFSAKCMRRMKQMMDEGVTVLFVSHDVSAVKSLCQRAVLLDKGRMVDLGPAGTVVDRYFALKVASQQAVVPGPSDAPKSELAQGTRALPLYFKRDPEFDHRAAFQRTRNGKAQFTSVQLLGNDGTVLTDVKYGQEVTLRMCIEVLKHIPGELCHGYHIRNHKGVDVVYSDSAIEGRSIFGAQEGDCFVVEWRFTTKLQHGVYTLVTVLSLPIDLSQALVEFCDLVPMAHVFQMHMRPEAHLHGAVHWENKVQLYCTSSQQEETAI